MEVDRPDLLRATSPRCLLHRLTEELQAEKARSCCSRQNPTSSRRFVVEEVELVRLIVPLTGPEY